MTLDTTISELRSLHRRRRFAMKIQQKLDRALESYIRVNGTEWHPDLSEAEREKFNKLVKKIIDQTRKGEGTAFDGVVKMSDEARGPADRDRKLTEAQMEAQAEQLPVYAWVESVRGAGALGLATIIAETGDLSNYPNVAKVWSRLGFAPYDGFAGSSWKRETWRPRTLTKDEWIEHPFSGARYALMHQIALWLVNAQWIGKAKSDTGEGKPNGPYGEVYAKRRAHTQTTHPEWSDGHRRMDGLRVAMKAFLKDLYLQWRELTPVHTESGRQNLGEAHLASATAAPGRQIFEAQFLNAGHTSSNRGRQRPSEAHAGLATAAPGQKGIVAQLIDAGRPSSTKRGRHAPVEAQITRATAAPGQVAYEAHQVRAGRTNQKGGRQLTAEAQHPRATAAPGHTSTEAHAPRAGRTHKTSASRSAFFKGE